MRPFSVRRGSFPILDGIEFDNGNVVISTREAPMKTTIYQSFMDFKKDYIDMMNISDVHLIWFKPLLEDVTQELTLQGGQKKKVVKGPRGKWVR